MQLQRVILALVLGSVVLGMAGLSLTPGAWSDPLRTASHTVAGIRATVEAGLGQTRAFIAGVLEQGRAGAATVLDGLDAALGSSGAGPGAGAGPAPGGLTGIVRVIDGDTLEVGGHRLRLRRIDAPETGQVCYSPGGPWACGRGAAKVLAGWTAGREVSCTARERDRYGRMLGDCSLDGVDLGEAMVIQGWALAWPGAGLDRQEAAARQARHGLWGSRFVAPWDWRRGQRVRR